MVRLSVIVIETIAVEAGISVNIFEQMVFENVYNDNYTASSSLNRYPWIVMRPNEKLLCYVVDLTCHNCTKEVCVYVTKADRGIFDLPCSCGVNTRIILYEPSWLE